MAVGSREFYVIIEAHTVHVTRKFLTNKGSNVGESSIISVVISYDLHAFGLFGPINYCFNYEEVESEMKKRPSPTEKLNKYGSFGGTNCTFILQTYLFDFLCEPV